LIIAVTILFLLSAQTGLQRGIKYLSNTNWPLLFSFYSIPLFYPFVLGPTNFNIEVFTSTFWEYLQNLPTMSLDLAPEDSSWIKNWPIFYWAW